MNLARFEIRFARIARRLAMLSACIACLIPPSTLANVIPSADPVTATEGSFSNATVATFTTSDPSPLVSNFVASIDWGDGTVTAGTVTASDPPAGFSISGGHAYADEGSYSITVAITDFFDSSSASAFPSATIADAPLTANGVYFASTPGTPFSGVVATFVDGNPFATASNFSGVIDWGDGTSTLPTITSNGSGNFNVTGSHTYISAGLKTVMVAIDDAGGSTASAVSHTGDRIFADGFGG